jgi:hypothetical protein
MGREPVFRSPPKIRNSRAASLKVERPLELAELLGLRELLRQVTRKQQGLRGEEEDRENTGNPSESRVLLLAKVRASNRHRLGLRSRQNLLDQAQVKLKERSRLLLRERNPL